MTFQFLEGVEKMNLLTNLVDFGFFTAAQNANRDSVVSLNSTGTIVGTVLRQTGGIVFENRSNAHHLYFSGLRETPKGRSLLVWASPSYEPNTNRNYNTAIFELAGSYGKPLDFATSFVYHGGANPNPFFFNGIEQKILPDHSTWGGNSIVLAAVSTHKTKTEYLYKMDYPNSYTHWEVPLPANISPKYLCFAYRKSLSPELGWRGLVRGFAYFDRPLTTNEILELDKSVPRIGVIFEGDSKTIGNSWPHYYCQGTNTWGFYSILTNSAVGGTVVSRANSISNSMEERWTAVSHFKTNSQYPIVIYHLRGGHNDFIWPGLATASSISNAFTAITNLWLLAREHGFKVGAWTLDRTGTTYAGNNTNYLRELNTSLRNLSGNYDTLMDAENWFVDQFGELPFTNPDVYEPSTLAAVHETSAVAKMLGLAASDRCALQFNPVKLSIKLSPIDARRQLLEVIGLANASEVQLESSCDLSTWNVEQSLVPSGTYASATNSVESLSGFKFYRVRHE